MCGVSTVRHIQKVTSNKFEIIFGLNLFVINNPVVDDVWSAASLCLVTNDDAAGVLLEHGQDQRMGGVDGVGDELPVLGELQGEGGHVPHYLGSLLNVITRNIGQHPVDVHLGQDTRYSYIIFMRPSS